MRAGWGWVCAAVAAVPGCVDASYRCVDDTQCSLEAHGRCEGAGYCSYPHGACASGRRFSDVAGGRAGECTDPDDTLAEATSNTDDTGPASGTSEASSGRADGSSADASTSGSAAVCGDDVVEAPETCDDPDGSQAIGCTDACALGLALIRFEIYDVSGGDDHFQAVAALPSGGVVLVGDDQTADGNRDALLLRMDADGEQQWLARYDQAGDTDEMHGVAVAGDGTIYASGSTQGPDGWSAFRGRWESDGKPGFVQLIPAYAQALAIDRTVQETLVVVGGSFANGDGFAARFPAHNAGADWQLEAVDRAGGSASLRDVSALSQGEAFAIGHIGNRLTLARVDGGVLDVRYQHPPALDPPQDLGQSIARSDELLVVAGYVTDATGRAAWLGGLALDGTLQWSHTMTDPSGLVEYEAVAIDGAGRIFAGGFRGGDGKAAILSGHDPDGTRRWVFAVPGTSESVVRDLAFDVEGRLWVVGETESDAGDLDAFFAIVDVTP